MKKDIEEIKIILAEMKQRIMYIEECEERQSQTTSQRQWQGSDNKQQEENYNDT